MAASPRLPLRRFAFDYSYWSHDGFDVLEQPEPDLELPGGGYNAPTNRRGGPTTSGFGCEYASQQFVYQGLGRAVLNNALNGFNCNLFAYGASGSGKSFSFVGYGGNPGRLVQTLERIFEKRAAREAQRLEEKRQKKEKNHAQARDREAAAAASGTINDVAARMRATPWRRRFGGRRAKLPCREDVPLPDMQGKAPLNRILSPARHLHTTRLCYQSVCVVSTLRPLSCIAPERFLAHSCVPPCLRCAQRSGSTGKKNGTETRPRIRYQKQDRILGRPKELLLFSKTSD